MDELDVLACTDNGDEWDDAYHGSLVKYITTQRQLLALRRQHEDEVGSMHKTLKEKVQPAHSPSSPRAFDHRDAAQFSFLAPQNLSLKMSTCTPPICLPPSHRPRLSLLEASLINLPLNLPSRKRTVTVLPEPSLEPGSLLTSGWTNV